MSEEKPADFEKPTNGAEERSALIHPGLAGADAKVLAALRDHQPLLVLLSVSLVVATFAESDLAAGLAVAAFGTFFLTTLFSLYATLDPEARGPARELVSGLIVVHLALGLLFLGLAGAALLAGRGNYGNLPFIPYLLWAIIAVGFMFYREYRRAVVAERRTRAVRVYEYNCLGILLLLPFTTLGLLALFVLPRNPAEPFFTAVTYPQMLLFISSLFARAEAEKDLSPEPSPATPARPPGGKS